MKKLTIGMPTYDDFDGVYFSITAIRLYHPELVNDIEFLVVDNNPTGKHAQITREFVESIGGIYIPFTKWTSSSVGKDLVFKYASAPHVVCIDSHVLIAPGALLKLLEYFRQNPHCKDLLQGPLVNNNFSVSTHFNPVWRGQMWGIWARDERGADPDGAPFEIEMQGTGLIACRNDAWLGFNDLFRGFGGQAGYIHAKYRKAGRTTVCLPFLRWMHRFGRPEGTKYRVAAVDKFRNYVIGFRELGMDLDPVIAHFEPVLKESAMEEIISEVDKQMATGPLVACLMMTYNRLPSGSNLLNEAIYSFHRQGYPKKELVIVNDCPGQLINYDHPDVVVANVSRRFETLGEKLNLAASLTKADLLCIWDDDDICLPWRLEVAVAKLGSKRLWQPDAHWTMNDGLLTYIDREGQLPLKGIFTHELFDEVGGFIPASKSIDRDLQSRMLAAAAGDSLREPVSREECAYIYRFRGTDSYHHTNVDYATVGTLRVEECIFMPDPFWSQDYVKQAKDAGQSAEKASR